MDGLHIGQLDDTADGASMRERCRSESKYRSSCITIFFGKEVLRKTEWSSAVAQDVGLRFSIKISIGLISVHDVDRISTGVRSEILRMLDELH